MTDTLGDRMKAYEGAESLRRALPSLPIMIRVDGKSFSQWTKGLNYPFDLRMEEARRATTRALIEELGAQIGYHQSDEISLVLYNPEPTAQMYAGGRLQKICSHAASIATATWNQFARKNISENKELAYFDARVWTVPSLEEAANALLWRELDATKNSVSMACRSVYNHGEMKGKSTNEMKEMLFKKGIQWNDYDVWMKRGLFMARRTTERVLTSEELKELPEKHHARLNPNMVVRRSEVKALEMPPFSRVTNRAGVILGEEPLLSTV